MTSFQDKFQKRDPKVIAKKEQGGTMQAVQSARADCIYLVRGKDSTGRQAWYYIMVEKLKKRVFEQDIKKGRIELTDYGSIITSAYGDNPPDDVKQRMKDEYGYEE